MPEFLHQLEIPVHDRIGNFLFLYVILHVFPFFVFVHADDVQAAGGIFLVQAFDQGKFRVAVGAP